ncbi:MAG TPA: PP2C family serine/threonine-protein phosphatase [Ktedonobacteraceae bacterium]|nr:PP2C family serine/threonine-protein phosphatase [Ktedonobacteraceae bacterium]
MVHSKTFLERAIVIESANQPRGQGDSEDDVLVARGLLGIFDSVGGRDRGRLVSHLAGNIVSSAWQSLSDHERQGPPEQLEVVLGMLLRKADTAIASLEIPPEQRRPATVAALCAYAVQQGQAFLSVAHVGDSRIYLLREGQPLQRLTKDHGYFSFAVRRGLLAEEEALRIEQAERVEELSAGDLAHFTRRNEITCAIGWSDFPHIPASSRPFLPGDCILLCTDGVHDNLADREIEEHLRMSKASGAHQLVHAAYERSQTNHLRAKRDDISALVAWYPALTPE